MPNKPESTTWKDVKAALVSKETKELLAVIQQLYALDEGNQQFLHAHCGLGDPIQHYRDQIEANICPDPMSRAEEFSIAKARRAISDYRKASGEPEAVLDLMIHFVECGTRCTLQYGDLWEEYYASMESMFGKAVKMLKTMDAKTRKKHLPRLERLVRDTEGVVGWGYHDALADLLYESFPDAAAE